MSAGANLGAPRINWRWMSLAIVVAGTLLFIGANAHLVHVALRSQPDCVQHLKSEGTGGTFRAAQSSC